MLGRINPGKWKYQEGQFDLFGFFFKFSPKSPRNFSEKNKKSWRALICDLLMVGSMLEVDFTQSYGKNTNSHIQDFHGYFAIKTY